MDNEEKKDVTEEIAEEQKVEIVETQAVEEEKNETVEKVEESKIESAEKIEEPKIDATVDENKTKKSSKTPIIVGSVVGGVLAILLIIIIVALVNIFSKPSKSQAKKIVETYLEALNDKDKEALLKTIDTDGYIIFKEEGEKRFNEKYKDKNKYIRKYMEKNDLDDTDDLDKVVLKDFNYSLKSSPYKYTLKEITDVKKSDKSNKVILIKGKVKVESLTSDTTKVARIYVTKAKDGKYKIISAELV